jgi:hypothetical protein
MAIVDSEEGALWPLFMLSVFRFHNIQNNGNSVLIIRSHETLVSISSVRSHNPVPSQTAFGGFVIWNYNSRSRLQRQLPCVLVLISFDRGILMKHLVHVQSCK